MMRYLAPALLLLAASTQAEILPLTPGASLLGATYMIESRADQTTPELAMHNEVGYYELLWANQLAWSRAGVHRWSPGDGAPVQIPRAFILPGATREGIVLNLAEMRLYFYEQDQVRTYPISIGRMDWSTPLGRSEVIIAVPEPTWYPTASIRKEHAERGDPLPLVVPPGPDNPMGAYAIQLSVPGYFIHGTNRAEGIGMRVTHGCVRMRNRDILDLVPQIRKGTPVEILALPIKVAVHNGIVYMEAHPPMREEIPIPEDNPVLDETQVGVPVEAVEEQLAPGDYAIEWEKVMTVAREARGVPIAIGWTVSDDALAEGAPVALLHIASDS